MLTIWRMKISVGIDLSNKS